VKEPTSGEHGEELLFLFLYAWQHNFGFQFVRQGRCGHCCALPESSKVLLIQAFIKLVGSHRVQRPVNPGAARSWHRWRPVAVDVLRDTAGTLLVPATSADQPGPIFGFRSRRPIPGRALGVSVRLLNNEWSAFQSSRRSRAAVADGGARRGSFTFAKQKMTSNRSRLIGMSRSIKRRWVLPRECPPTRRRLVS
jgi:hypothetical protein